MEFKLGGKITLSGDREYYILDFVNFNNEEYLFCTTAKGKIRPAVLQVGNINGEKKVRVEKDPEIIKEISTKILEKEDKELLEKIMKENG